MISENQELIKAEARVQTLTQKVEFRDKGKRGRFVGELTKAKAERDKILFKITNDSTETKELIKRALEVKEKQEALGKKLKEHSESLDNLSLFMDLMENGIPKWSDSHFRTPEPDYEQIREGLIKERNLQEKLKTAQKLFDSTNLRAKSSSPVGKSGRTAQLQKARNELNSVLKQVEQQPDLIEFYTLRAKKNWLETVVKEKEEELAFNQVELNKAEKILDGF